MSVAPDLDELTFAVRASRSVAGIAAADLLVADGTIEDEAGELFEAEIVEPWLNGPEALRGLLFSVPARSTRTSLTCSAAPGHKSSGTAPPRPRWRRTPSRKPSTGPSALSRRPTSSAQCAGRT